MEQITVFIQIRQIFVEVFTQRFTAFGIISIFVYILTSTETIEMAIALTG
jgi:hypothetical protein